MDGVLFLDMDGVLCTVRAHYAYGMDKAGKRLMRALDPISIMLVDRLCEDFNLQIVVSSTWRGDNDCGIVLKSLLNSHGLKAQFHKDWRTDHEFTFSKPNGLRDREIEEWLDNHPEIKRFVILDDECMRFMHSNKLKNNFVNTHPEDGVTTKNYWDAVEILSNYTMENNREIQISSDTKH